MANLFILSVIRQKIQTPQSPPLAFAPSLKVGGRQRHQRILGERRQNTQAVSGSCFPGLVSKWPNPETTTGSVFFRGPPKTMVSLWLPFKTAKRAPPRKTAPNRVMCEEWMKGLEMMMVCCLILRSCTVAKACLQGWDLQLKPWMPLKWVASSTPFKHSISDTHIVLDFARACNDFSSTGRVAHRKRPV